MAEEEAADEEDSVKSSSYISFSSLWLWRGGETMGAASADANVSQ